MNSCVSTYQRVRCFGDTRILLLSGCFGCLSKNKQKAMNWFCNDSARGLDEATIICENGQTDSECKTKCGYSYPNSRITHVCDPPGHPDCPNSPLGCVAIHEAAHAVGGVGKDGKPSAKNYDPHGYDIQDCAGCQRPPGY
jgi:hypothetical protein